MEGQTITSSSSVFDSYATSYRRVINKSVAASGHEYEFFADLRVRMMRDRLERYCPECRTDTILDFGCGIGATEVFIRKHFPESSIHGYDTSSECIAEAKKLNMPGVVFTAGDNSGPPYKWGTFNVIYMNGTMHHIDPMERPHVLATLRRLLAPGGFIFIFENNPDNPLMMRAMRINPFDDGISAIRSREMEDEGRLAGFSVVEKWYYFFFPRNLGFLRPMESSLSWLPIGAQYCVWLTCSTAIFSYEKSMFAKEAGNVAIF